MKRIIASIAMAASIPAVAPAQTAQQVELCGAIGQMAANIMVKRQEQIPMSTMVQIIMSQPESAMRTVAYSLVVDAYDMPAFSSAEYQSGAVMEFRNDAEAECFRAIGN